MAVIKNNNTDKKVLVENQIKPKTYSWSAKSIVLLILISVTVTLTFTSLLYFGTRSFLKLLSKQEWDFLLFTQQYPISACIYYERDTDLAKNSCNFADNRYAWTVHGIWPSKDHSKHSPEKCQRIPFNESAIKSILPQLEEHWLTIKKGSQDTTFWKHEWQKHGTCAAQIPPMNTEFKYFNQGLKWNQQYNIGETLKNCGIQPNDEKLYSNKDVINCIKDEFDVEPQIHCVANHNGNGKLLLVEVRLCFEKNLELVTCAKYESQLNCEHDFVYPETIGAATYTNKEWWM